ncbi:MAG TPA: hypothetical protein PLL18_15700, partial [Flavobacteriales bacterium]|nr:hypothetical protein [Flavobacteriales bacterium]
MATNFEFGLDTFGDITVDTSGKLLKHDEVLRNIVTEAELADQLGLHPGMSVLDIGSGIGGLITLETQHRNL